MRWSGLRAAVVERFAPEFQKRLDIHSAAYGACTCGHAWLTFDGNIIANFCTRAHSIANGWEPASTRENPMYRNQYTDFGELSRQDAYQACWAFVHDLSIEQALNDDDPLIQSLAVADSRIGKRRLVQLDASLLHRLPAHILELRRTILGIERRNAA
ncbi:hypothetical protein [Sphingopyxis sp. H115]|uniref:SF0329 family protein n=1 Tax=Sphingopyxis sp. H115 TaxID=1759073 RepID=UPI0009E6789A|nr:hypothetical protein [Sphingopyxis sp. H115]